METITSAQTAKISQEEEPPSHLAVGITPHLRRLARKSPAVRREFFPSLEEHNYSKWSFTDPLLEDEFMKVKGLVHKYPTRVLITLTMTCAAYCRFCTRRRIVSDFERGRLTHKDVDNMVGYLKSQPGINEVIFSGGDPLTAQPLLIYALGKISKLKQIKIVRVHTRVPVSNPKLVTPKILLAFKKITRQPLYVSVHFEHPDELTRPTIKAVTAIRKTGAIMLCQSVFLKGVNDNYHVLAELFTRLSELGIRPYYIYRCDPVRGVEHFRVPMEKEIEIMTELRAKLSGIAFPTYVIDTPNGAGKVPVPLGFWEFKRDHFSDFDGKQIEII